MEFVDKTALFGEFEPTSNAVTSTSAGLASTSSLSTVTLSPVETDELNLKLRIIQIASVSSGFFKHQQKDDPDLTKEEKRTIVTELLENRPSVFLARFGKFLSEDHLAFFDEIKDNYEVEFYLKEARQSQCKIVQDLKVKNRRFQAMQNMIKDGDDHFSEENMRQRNPLLYHQLIGEHMTEEEKAVAERPDMTNCSLTNIIIEHMDLNRERELKKRLKGVEDEEEFDSDSEDEGPTPQATPINTYVNTEEDKESMRREFVQAAYRSFLAGKDSGVDYRKIDEDSSLDDLKLESQELEERYFDDEELED